jgi:hypothetical protein
VGKPLGWVVKDLSNKITTSSSSSSSSSFKEEFACTKLSFVETQLSQNPLEPIVVVLGLTIHSSGVGFAK